MSHDTIDALAREASPATSMETQGQRGRQLLFKVVVISLSSLLALGLLEVAAQVQQWLKYGAEGPPATEHFRLVSSGYYVRHDVLGWLPNKNVSGRHRQAGSFDSSFHTNSRGLRGRERALERLPSVSRIVVLGDSFTWGWGVNDEFVYPVVMESLLHGPEVINLGVTAYGTRQEIDYLKLEGIKYRPDIVLVGFCLNDIYDVSSPLEKFQSAGVSMAEADRSTHPTPLQTVKHWLNRSRLYHLAREAVNTNKFIVKLFVRLGLKEGLTGFDDLDPSLMPALRAYPPQLQNAIERNQAELLELKDFLAEHKIRFILALIPSVQSVDPRALQASIAYSVFDPGDFDLDKPYRLLEDFARQHGIEVINTYPALKRQQQSGASLYLPNEIHFNREGHAAFARQLVDYLNGH
jgi:lysophospholipase L1-like esterase